MNRYTTIHQACLEQGIDLGAVRFDLGALATTGARPFQPERWIVYNDDGTEGYYQVASGDTLAGLAALYLDSAARWPDIWNAQPAERRTGGSPDAIYADEWLNMPQEAAQNARALNGGQPLPGLVGKKANGKGEKLDGQAEAKKVPSWLWWVAGGTAAAVVLYSVTR